MHYTPSLTSQRKALHPPPFTSKVVGFSTHGAVRGAADAAAGGTFVAASPFFPSFPAAEAVGVAAAADPFHLAHKDSAAGLTDAHCRVRDRRTSEALRATVAFIDTCVCLCCTAGLA